MILIFVVPPSVFIFTLLQNPVFNIQYFIFHPWDLVLGFDSRLEHFRSSIPSYINGSFCILRIRKQNEKLEQQAIAHI
jgi:hypothetical protein